MQQKISASLMCSKMMDLPKYLESFERNKIDFLHLDIMDGHFAKNLTFGTAQTKEIRELCPNIPFDYHFMTKNLGEIVPWFDIQRGDNVSFHPETTSNPSKIIDYIHSKGATATVALTLEEPLETLENFVKDIDGIMLMTVTVGFSGSPIHPSSFDKVAKAADMVARILGTENAKDFRIQIDGNMSPENASKMRAIGANTFVVGTAAIFKENIADVDQRIDLFKSAIAG